MVNANADSSIADVSAVASDELFLASAHFAEGKRRLERARRQFGDDRLLAMLTGTASRMLAVIDWYQRGRR